MRAGRDLRVFWLKNTLYAKMNTMNTVKQGRYRWMIFKDGNDWVGVALEFNIVVTGQDPRVVEVELQEAVLGYLEAAKKLKGFRANQVNALLNQKSDDEYEERWTRARQIFTAPKKGGVVSPLSGIYKAGISSLAVA